MPIVMLRFSQLEWFILYYSQSQALEEGIVVENNINLKLTTIY